MADFFVILALFGVPTLIIWFNLYMVCLDTMLEVGYDPVAFARYPSCVLRPALRRYRKALAEKEKIEKIDKFNF